MVAVVFLLTLASVLTAVTGLATTARKVALEAERPGLPKTGDFIGGKFEHLSKHANKLPSLALLKTHKTGSSTLANILHRLGDRRNMSFMVPPDNVHLGWPSGFPGSKALEKYGAPKHQFDIIANHAIFDNDAFRSYLKDKEPHFVAVVRDPITQAISAKDYFHQNNIAWDDHLQWLQSLNPITDFHACSEEITDDHIQQNCDVSIAHFLNPQAHDMGWHKFVEKAGISGEGDSSLTAEWLKVLDKELNPARSIILAEYFNEGLVLMRQKLGCDLAELSYFRMKVKEKHRKLPSTSQLEKLKKVNAVDVALYEHLNKTFWKEWEDGDQEVLNRELSELAKMNADLIKTCTELNWDKTHCPQEFVTDEVKYGVALKRKQSDWGLKLK